MITAFTEAFDTLGDKHYLDAAIEAAEQLWKSARPTPDILWRTRFHGKTSIDARQSDYAFFPEALVSLYDITGNAVWLNRAEELTTDMLEHFWDQANGGFYMTPVNKDVTAIFVRPKDLQDASMPAGNAVALRVLSRLYKRTGKPKYSEYADRQIAFYGGALERQSSGHDYLLSGISDYLSGETGRRQYGARGALKVTAVRADDGSIAVHMDISPGWHINSNKPYQDYLIPTTLSAIEGDLGSITYPDAIDRRLGFERSVLSLYEGSVTLRAQAAEPGVRQLQTRLQACSDKVCLPPETLTLHLTR